MARVTVTVGHRGLFHSAFLEAAMPGSRNELNWFSTNLIDVLPAAVYVCQFSSGNCRL